MEGNKDESERCLLVAERLIKSGNFDKALKLIHKSQKLYPTEKAKVLQETVYKILDRNSHAKHHDHGSSGAGGDHNKQPRERRPSSGPKSGHDTPSETKGDGDVTAEQKTAVEMVLSKKCFYEILAVSKDATEMDLKKSYRKLALLLHPDKNRAPRAGEAFKAVGNAFAILSDAEKRRRYDLYGAEEEASVNHHRFSRRNANYDEFEADISPEDLFNMFFGGGFPSTHVYHFGPGRNRRAYRFTANEAGYRQRQGEREQPQSNYGLLFNFAPLILLIFLSFAGSWFQADPIFAFSPSSKYTVQRSTVNLRVPYYVKQDFSESYRGNMRRLELQIEEDYIATLRHSCFKERSYKESLLWQARTYGDPYKLQRAQELKTPACDRLSSLYA